MMASLTLRCFEHDRYDKKILDRNCPGSNPIQNQTLSPNLITKWCSFRVKQFAGYTINCTFCKFCYKLFCSTNSEEADLNKCCRKRTGPWNEVNCWLHLRPMWKSSASSAGISLLGRLLLMRRSRKKSFSVRLLPHQRQLQHLQPYLTGRGRSPLLILKQKGFYWQALCSWTRTWKTAPPVPQSSVLLFSHRWFISRDLSGNRLVLTVLKLILPWLMRIWIIQIFSLNVTSKSGWV